jgi:NAD(P)-dependent dehydrogenase (short-subunit alcohol dehydrogenase family)
MSVVLVTGAGSGFGEAIALAFAGAGHQVIATMREPNRAPAALRSMARIELAPLDVTDPGSREAAIASALARHDRIDVLVNNAGIAPAASLEDTPDTLLRLVFETNYFGPVDLMRRLLPAMRAQNGGRIVNVSAAGAIMTTPLLNAYCASKHALDSTGAALDIEARSFGVRVVSVLPGPFRTAIAEKSPAVETSSPYRSVAEALRRTRMNGQPPSDDLQSVTTAVLEAASAARPRVRYLVPGALAGQIAAAVVELERVHYFEVARARLG